MKPTEALPSSCIYPGPWRKDWVCTLGTETPPPGQHVEMTWSPQHFLYVGVGEMVVRGVPFPPRWMLAAFEGLIRVHFL